MKYVVLYKSAEDVASKAPAHFPAHADWYRRFADAGTLLMVGTFEDPQTQGAMSIFTTRQAAEEFVAGDPFVTNGVIQSYEIRGWNEALTP